MGVFYIKTYCNVDGVWRTIKNTYVNINGISKKILEPKVNINGVWKDENYIITIYHNKKVWQTLICGKGSNITLPTLSDGAGYATSSTSVNKIYNNGALITPSNNMDLYTLMYEYTYSGQTINDGSFSSDCSQNISITFNGGTIASKNTGTSYFSTTELNTVTRPPYIKIGNVFLTGSYTKGQTINTPVSKGCYVTVSTYWDDNYSSGGSLYDFDISVYYQKQIGSNIINTNI